MLFVLAIAVRTIKTNLTTFRSVREAADAAMRAEIDRQAQAWLTA